MESSYWKWAWAMLGVHAMFAGISWFWLPARVPMHFNAAGVADAWVGKSPLFWFGLLLPSVFLFTLIYGLSRPASMATWNIPEKERFVKLTGEQQRPVMKLMSQFGAGTTMALVGLFLALQVGMYLAAMGVGPGPVTPGGLPWFIMLIIAAVPIGIVVAMVPWSNAVKQAILAAESIL